MELLGEVGDRGICTSELFQDAASGGVRERGERGIEASRRILNHLVQFITQALAPCKSLWRNGAIGGLREREDLHGLTTRAPAVLSGGSIQDEPDPSDIHLDCPAGKRG